MTATSQRRITDRRHLWLIAAGLLLAACVVTYWSVSDYQLRQFRSAAEVARQRSDWGRLAVASRLWLDRQPDDPLALTFAAEAAQARGSFDRAAEFLQRLPRTDPRSADGLWQLATLYRLPLNQPDLAVETLRDVIELKPTLHQARSDLLRFYAITLQSDAVRELARQSVLAGETPLITYVYLMDFDAIVFARGVDDNAHWLKRHPASELFHIASIVHSAQAIDNGVAREGFVDTEQRQRQVSEQMKLLSEGLVKYPGSRELLIAALKLHSDRGERDQVARLLSQVPASAAGDSRVWRYKGWLHRANDELEQAEAAYRTAIETNPYDWKSRTQLGEVLRLQNRMSDAEEQLLIAETGHELETTLMNMDSVVELPIPVMQTMRLNAEQVGDVRVAKQLARRIASSTSEQAAN